MNDHHDQQAAASRLTHRPEAEPVRSRWTPKPEQILILESIFNGGMVNPPKDETVKIRKMLEKYGPVGDANVFYWFQNRRSRSRCRQRQAAAAASAAVEPPRGGSGGFVNDHDFNYSGPLFSNSTTPTRVGAGPSSSFGPGDATNSSDYFSFSGRPDGQGELFEGSSYFGGPDTSSNLHYQSGVITVFINGVATEVGRSSPLDVNMMFGGDFVLVHSSGMAVEVDGLQHGESYFLVPRHS